LRGKRIDLEGKSEGAGLPEMVAQRTIQKGNLPARDLSHQPVFPLLVRSEGLALLATPKSPEDLDGGDAIGRGCKADSYKAVSDAGRNSATVSARAP
jgi:hypothetical protein